MSELTLYQPAVQENFLELYTHTKKLADIAPNRTVVLQEGSEGLLPDHIEQRTRRPFSARALIMPKGELPYTERETLCRSTMRVLYEKNDSLYLKMRPLSPGGEGAVFTATAFRHGRLFSEMIPDTAGEKRRCLFGVLPGRQVLIDGFTVPNIEDPLNETYGLGMAIQVAKDRGFSNIRLCARGLKAPASEAKPMEDLEELYHLSRELPLYDKVILTEYDDKGQIQTETIDIDRRDEACVSSILSRRSGTAEN